MFTGLVDDVGTIERIAPIAAGREFRIRCRYDDLEEGESIAVNGACLTVRGRGPHWFNAAAVVTTLARTTMAEWRPGRRVNLERSIRAGDRFGGHMVQGHVDGVAHVTGVRAAGDARLIDLALPAGLADLMVRHGSIAVDGVSLTINDIPGPDVVQLSLIEYTLRHTALDTLGEGDDVHVEADMMGKYVQKMLGAYRSLAPDT